MRLRLKVVARSSRSEVAGWVGETLKVFVAAPPERGKANAAVEEILADALGLPRDAVRLTSGLTSTRKVVEITGLEPDEVHRRLSTPERKIPS